MCALVFPVWAETAPLSAFPRADEWKLAASRFTVAELPTFYSSYAETVPLMVLQKLTGKFRRNVQNAETRARALQTYDQGLEKLLQERYALVSIRDKILFEAVSPATRTKRRKAADANVRAKESEIRQYQKTGVSFETPAGISDRGAGESGIPALVTLWESGSRLFDPGTAPLAQTLRNSGIQGLLTGSLEDIAGYLVVTLSLETGLPGLDPLVTKAAGPYEELDSIVDALASAVKTTLSFVDPVTLRFSVSRENVSVFVDGAKLPPGTREVTVAEGYHRIEATAPGFLPSSEESDFSGASAFSVAIDLEIETLVPAGFSSSVTGSLLYLETVYLGESPLQSHIPPRISLGRAVAGDVSTWYYLDATEYATAYRIESNKVNTKALIDKRRSVLYWSLGALYISLPFAMLTHGVTQDKLRAYDADYLTKDQATINEINGWFLASNVTTGISIGLGINYAAQLVRYLLAADQALPRRARPVKQSNPVPGE